MPKTVLTKKQRELIIEIRQLLKKHYFDPDEIVREAELAVRTHCLQNTKDRIIRFQVIENYLLMDEALSAVIRWHFFGKKHLFPQLMKRKRFKAFNYFILERLYLLQKLDFVRGFYSIPKWVASDLAELNDLRNGLAHSLYLQFRRRQPQWKGQGIFTLAGFDRFCDDMKKLFEFFVVSFWPVARKGSRDKAQRREKETSSGPMVPLRHPLFNRDQNPIAR